MGVGPKRKTYPQRATEDFPKWIPDGKAQFEKLNKKSSEALEPYERFLKKSYFPEMQKAFDKEQKEKQKSGAMSSQAATQGKHKRNETTRFGRGTQVVYCFYVIFCRNFSESIV